MMDQYTMVDRGSADYMRSMAQRQAEAMRNADPITRYSQAQMANMYPSAPYESQSMNRKLAEAKKFLSGRAR